MNNKIKLVSFDIWGTLIKSHASFSKKRNDLIYSRLGYLGDRAVFDKAMKEVKLSIDLLAEKTGQDYDFTYRIKKLCEILSIDPIRTESFYQELEADFDHLFLECAPSLIDKDTIALMTDLKSKGIKIALLSNTGLINGKTMRKALDTLGILKFCDQVVFSDEVSFAKPNPNIFSLLLKDSLLSNEVLHVGDNNEADAKGAALCGMNSFLFVENKNKITDIISNLR